jgi:hypothetical protein
MRHTFWFDVVDGVECLKRPMLRYGILRRLEECARRQQITVLAFGVHDTQVRVVMEGEHDAAELAIRGVKVGTHRHASSFESGLVLGDTRSVSLHEHDLVEAVAWCHRLDGRADPLSSPWTSHRDLLGLRDADYFDARRIRALVDAAEVHALCGGQPAPTAEPAHEGSPSRRPLQLLLRIAASVRGVLPANRSCFGLFVQLAVREGWQQAPIAKALMLTPRRVRQLSRLDEPMLPAALRHLQDQRLVLAA